MRRHLLSLFLFSIVCFTFFNAAKANHLYGGATPLMRITEYMYDGANKEFVEFTNVGTTPIDMTGWSYDDDSRTPGTVSLSAFGTVQAGESVILAESSAADFRTAWGLCDNVKIIGNLATNLGRADEINLFDGGNNLVDRLTYDDQGIAGSIRTQNISGIVSAAGLGANDITKWSLSSVGDAEGSVTSTGGDIGSPGKSTQATVAFNPCPPPLMRITEYMYDGANKEFVEFTNVGSTPIDMTGWSYDDDSRTPGTVSLSAFGTVQAGESVILAESSAADFRTAWGLCDNVKIIGNLATNLGRADEINLFDGGNNLVDRLTYDDQGIAGSIRTQNISGIVSAAGLGANDITKWSLSSVGDAEGSVTSTGGDIGSPGKSTRATVAFTPCLPGTMRITEYMYDGNNKEFVEFTNVGNASVDMTGWSYDDNGRTAGIVSLSGFGTVQAGESVILAESSAGDFRTAWGLCNNVKIIGGLSTNLGRSDEINLYDAASTLVDRLTYGDQDFTGTIRTQNQSGWVSAGGLGANDITKWTLSTIGDAEGSFASSGGDIGSPGKSTRAIVAYNPCTTAAGAPTISVDVAGTTDYLDGGAATSPVSPYAISSVINDAADPASALGINFTVGDDATQVENLTVTATSSNAAVVPNTNLVVSGTGASRNLKITPAGVGYADITVTVNDGTYNTSYIINYAASQSSSAAIKWPVGMADASAAIALNDDYMVIANDENNLLYVYNRNASGLPAKTYDFNAGNVLALTDGSTDNWKEVDVEAATSSTAHTGRTYWLGSMSNSSSFNDKPNRDRIIAVDIAGTGATATLSNAGYYAGLRQQLISWGDANGYNFTASAAAGNDPKTIDGFNAEGMVFGLDNTTLYIGFRAPLEPTANRTKAVIAPIQNFETWFNNGSPSGNPTIGLPIELDLGGRGIRDMIRLSNGNYVIIAGSYGGDLVPAIYRWTGIATDAPLALTSFDVTGLNAEAAVQVNEGGQLAADKLQIICDNGDNAFYDDGVAAKDLPQDNYKKFITEVLQSSAGDVLPVQYEYFTAQRNGKDVILNWKNDIPGGIASYDVTRSENGTDFKRIYTVLSLKNQTTYSFIDVNAPAVQLYYRIQAKDIYGQIFLSPVRIINPAGANGSVIKVYPNPVNNGTFSITVSQTGKKTVNIYNSAGALFRQISFSETVKDVSTGNWPKGFYLLRIATADNNIATEKIVVQ